MVKSVSIQGLEGLYSITKQGDVISHSKINNTAYSYYIRAEKVLTNCTDKDGYSVVMLSKNKKAKQYKIHRLVAQAFIPNPENKPCVNHIDGIKSNNLIDNLEWCSRKENTNHAYRIGLLKQDHARVLEMGLKAHAKTSIPISGYDKNTGVLLWTEKSVKEACRKHNLNESTIYQVLKGTSKYQQHKGLFFIKHG